MIFTNKIITTRHISQGLICLTLLAVISLLFLFSCKKKCIRRGNGGGIKVAFYDGNNAPISPVILRQIKFYYFKSNGMTDTFRVPNPPEDNVVSSDYMRISTVDVSFGILFQGITTATLDNQIKDGYLYLLFPDGITDTMNVQLRNVQGCDLYYNNYYIDGLIYNGQQAEFTHKMKMGSIDEGLNAFKVYIH